MLQVLNHLTSWHFVIHQVITYERCSNVKSWISWTQSGYIVMNEKATGKAGELLRLAGSQVVGVFHGLVNERLVRDAHR